MEELNSTIEPSKKCCRHKWPIFLALILVIGAIVIVSLLRDRIVNKQDYQVTVIGVGKVTIKPDIAIVNLGAQTVNEPTAKQALDKNNQIVNNVIAKLIAMGINKDDIKTSFYNLTPVYNNAVINNMIQSSQTDIVGYTADQQLTIKVRNIQGNDPKAIGAVIEAASILGANQVNGISYDYEQLEQVKQQARILAINDARVRAKELSDQTGVRLGKIVGWWENYVTNPSDSMNSMAYGKGGGAGGASPVIMPGNGEINLEMNVSYLVK